MILALYGIRAIRTALTVLYDWYHSVKPVIRGGQALTINLNRYASSVNLMNDVIRIITQSNSYLFMMGELLRGCSP